MVPDPQGRENGALPHRIHLLVHQGRYLHPDSRRINITDFRTEYAQRVEDALLELVDDVDWSLSGEDIQLGIEEAQPVCRLLVNELLTNSLRHAMPRPPAVHCHRVEGTWPCRGVLELRADSGQRSPSDLSPVHRHLRNPVVSLGLRLASTV